MASFVVQKMSTVTPIFYRIFLMFQTLPIGPNSRKIEQFLLIQWNYFNQGWVLAKGWALSSGCGAGACSWRYGNCFHGLKL